MGAKMASKARGRGALPKFNKTEAQRIRKAYGKSNGRGKPSTRGTTLKKLAEQFGASIATIHQVITQTGAYAPKPA